MSARNSHQDYVAHGQLSDPGAHAPLLDALPNDVSSLCRVVQGVLIHDYYGPLLYGAVPWADDPPSRATLPIAQRLDAIVARCRDPLSVPRPSAQRSVGTCRDFALMLCAMLRHRGIPARVRCGFADYFSPDFFEDHWVCEYWHQGDRRWALADAQLDDAHRRHLSIDFDIADLPTGRFLPAGRVWRQCRSGAIDPERCGQDDVTGLWFVAVDVARDLLSLNGHEVSAWDGWRDSRSKQRTLDPTALARFDRIAFLADSTDVALITERDGEVATLTGDPPMWRA